MVETSLPCLIYDSAADVQSRDIAALHDYWRANLHGRAVPRSADVDPADFPDLEPSIVTTDYSDHPFRVHYRQVGATQAHYSGENFAGCFLDELNWPEKDLMASMHERVYRARTPVFGRYQWEFRDGLPGFSEFAIFPLSADGATVTHGMTFDDYSFFEQQLGRAR